MPSAKVFLALAALLALGCALPSGFSIANIKGGFDGNNNIPTKIVFLPDGRVMYCHKNGQFHIAQANVFPLVTSLLFTIPNVNANGELGCAALLFFFSSFLVCIGCCLQGEWLLLCFFAVLLAAYFRAYLATRALKCILAR
jgi:hypothetical protein